MNMMWVWRERWNRLSDKFWMGLAWRLPHKLVMWTSVRVAAHATMGNFSGTVVPELSMIEAQKRWDDRKGGDRKYGNA